MTHTWRPRPGDVVVRRPRQAQLRPIVFQLTFPKPPSPGLASPVTIVYGFLLLVVVGTGLLLLPWANREGQVTPFMTALFTATSAATVTGLVVVDTASYWTTFGHGVIGSLILVGGLGWMTLASFLLLVIGQRLSLAHQLVMQQPLGLQQVGHVIRVMRQMVLTFLVIQVVGGVVLAWLFKGLLSEASWGTALWQGFFHSVAAFNNAGFAILPGSQNLSVLTLHVPTLVVMMALIILGGLSYPVMADLVRVRRWRRLALDTKMVVVASVALWIAGTLVVLGFEYAHQATLGTLPVWGKAINALFFSVSARTAGFTTVDFSGMNQATFFFIVALMFIGTASASTGGGIRINTLGVLVATVVASLRGQQYVNAFGREIPAQVVHRALAVASLGLGMVFIAAFLLTFIEPQGDFLSFLFEVVSAFGTVGLSTGVTPQLSVAGKIIIILTMLVGRLGPMGLALALLPRERPAMVRFAQEPVRIA
ncbi:MAG: potassium transporter TrkG [Chloroflexota bacterium]|nr:potassium transporter TrkG [Chloroflexota bacterium]